MRQKEFIKKIYKVLAEYAVSQIKIGIKKRKPCSQPEESEVAGTAILRSVYYFRQVALDSCLAEESDLPVQQCDRVPYRGGYEPELTVENISELIKRYFNDLIISAEMDIEIAKRHFKNPACNGNVALFRAKGALQAAFYVKAEAVSAEILKPSDLGASNYLSLLFHREVCSALKNPIDKNQLLENKHHSKHQPDDDSSLIPQCRHTCPSNSTHKEVKHD